VSATRTTTTAAPQPPRQQQQQIYARATTTTSTTPQQQQHATTTGVYKNYDPRAKLMRRVCHDVLASVDMADHPDLQLAQQLEAISRHQVVITR